MKSVESRLNLLLSSIPEVKNRGHRYPIKVRELCIELSASMGVRKVARHSGIAASSIYDWIRKSDSLAQCKPSPASAPQAERPLVLKEIGTTVSYPNPFESQITLVTAQGVTVHMPANERTISLILDRVVGGVG